MHFSFVHLIIKRQAYSTLGAVRCGANGGNGGWSESTGASVTAQYVDLIRFTSATTVSCYVYPSFATTSTPIYAQTVACALFYY